MVELTHPAVLKPWRPGKFRDKMRCSTASESRGLATVMSTVGRNVHSSPYAQVGVSLGTSRITSAVWLR